MAYTWNFSHEEIAAVTIPDKNLASVIQPNNVQIDPRSVQVLVTECLQSPIGMNRLRDELLGDERVLILVDDYTRMTPADRILPPMIREITESGVSYDQIKILVASGTHRAMSAEEKLKKCGRFVIEHIEVFDHIWYDEKQLTDLGKTEAGTEVMVNNLLMESDYIIGIGHIVPHRVAGYSGGAKIIQPGVCGAVTTGQTHWLSAKYFDGKDIMGVIDNPVRREINNVGKKVGLKFIFNTVQAGNGHVYQCVCGEPVCAHKAGCRAAEDVYGCEIDELSDIVISDAYPAHVNMWQSSKGVYAADLALKEDGILILVTPAPEGVAIEHPEVEEFGYSDPKGVEKLVDEGKLDDLTIAAHILHVGKVITGKRKAILVSPGLDRQRAEKIGFIWAETVQAAMEQALEIKGEDASVSLLKHGGETMPIYRKR